MNVIICDDKKEEMEGTVYFCRDYFLKKGMPCGITATTEPEDIWKELPDILILDIEMPKMSGIEIKQRLEGEDKPLIIFVTGYEEHMPEAFGRNVIGFLMKRFEMQNKREKRISLILLAAGIFLLGGELSVRL